MTLTTASGTLILDDDELPSTEDKNEIIAALTKPDDDGAQFQALCDASVWFPDDLTTFQFFRACGHWLDNNPD